NPGLTMPAHHDGRAAEQRFERIFEDTMEQRDAGYESLQAAGRTRADRCPSPTQCSRLAGNAGGARERIQDGAEPKPVERADAGAAARILSTALSHAVVPAHSASKTRVNALMLGTHDLRPAVMGPRNGVPAT